MRRLLSIALLALIVGAVYADLTITAGARPAAETACADC